MADSKKYNPRVPSEYQEIEHLESNGTQYIDTNIIPTNSAQTKVQFEFQLTDITNGIYQSIGCNSNMNFTSSQTLLKFRSNGIEIADFDTAWHICEISKSSSGKVTYFDGVEYSTSTATEEALPFILFGMSLIDNRYYSKYKLKYFKCYENNTLVRNMIPVRRVSDNVLGMYDIVNNVFYTNQGTGSFTAGSDVNAWVHSLRKLTTATDTITTLPVDVYADGNNATVGLVGNMSQTGTPTPQTPIQPSECGVRTGNLFDKTDTKTTEIAGVYTYTLKGLTPNESYTCTTNFTTTSNVASIYFGGTATGTNGVTASSPKTMTADNTGNIVLYVRYASQGTTAPPIYDDLMAGTIWIMVNEGSTALPYEPYGYKIPISSADTTTPVYLGEVETTRKIRKLVFDGSEDWVNAGTTGHIFRLEIQGYARIQDNIPISTHYSGISPVSIIANIPNLNIAFLISESGNNYFYVNDESITSIVDFKSYLQQQYVAGTPVTVWYILAEPETGIINEPLRKIGTYADTVSGISIPTITGRDTFDVQTTLKPSEVSLSYTGWHDASVKEKSRNLLNEAEPPQNIYITDSIRRMGYEVEVTAGTYTAYGDNSDLYAKTKINGIYGDAVQINNPQNLTLNSDGIIIIYSRVNGEFPDTNIMLNTGSTALPYEPYWK